MGNMIYQWRLTYGSNTTVVHPVYKDDMAISYEKESNQMFFRERLSGNLDFIGSEAKAIVDAPFETEFIVGLYASTNNGLSWSVMNTSRFYKTDCKIDADDLKVTVKPDVKDAYNIILDSLEKEYNLIELLPVTEKVRMKKRALLQLYTGDDKVTNVFGGFSWEQDFDIGENTPNDYHFKENMTFCVIKFVRTFGTGMTGLTKGFIAIPDANGEFETTNGEGVYYLKRVKWADDSYDLQLRLISDDTQVAHYWTPFVVLNDTLNFIDANDIAWGVAECDYYGVYARWLCDVPQFTVGGTTYNTYKLTANDPCFGGNLHYCIETDVEIQPSNELSTTPTKFGKYDATYYYDRPSQRGFFIPVARSFWGVASIWYKQRNEEYNVWEPAMQRTYYLKDSYPLWSVISVLLQANNTGVTFEPTTDYSEFFFGTTNPIADIDMGVPHITPKSNILVGEYTQPSMKAPITLQDVFDMLRRAFNCYWFIDGNNRLRIEHLSWFKNGGNYGGTHQIGIDVTEMIYMRNGRSWAFDTKKWQYDKIDMPARYQFKWMDAGTNVFDWFPMQVLSPFVQTDKVEEITISNFTSDVDYMQIAPENCSKDGFALLMVKNDGENYLPIISNERTQDGGTCHNVSQNFYVSLRWLQDNFLSWDMPAWRYECDGLQMAAWDIKRGKRQQINIPYGNVTPDLMKLVHTTIGDGQVQHMSLNLSSRMAKTTILYDTF